MKYKIEMEIDFDRRPTKKDVLNKLFDMLRDNNVEYKLHKYNNNLWAQIKRSIKNDKHNQRFNKSIFSMYSVVFTVFYITTNCVIIIC